VLDELEPPKQKLRADPGSPITSSHYTRNSGLPV